MNKQPDCYQYDQRQYDIIIIVLEMTEGLTNGQTG